MNRAALRYNKRSPIPEEFGWNQLVRLDGDELEIH
jgi:hypothetical protein